jgi:N-acyl-D-aspartate/D-glutamate deacylase
MERILIRGGNVIDGSGAPAYRADVVTQNGRIVAIGNNYEGTAHHTIDARDHVVAPGFIDVKTHSDFALPLYPRAENRVLQGITTELVGSCGFTAAPIPLGKLDSIASYLAAMAPAYTCSEATFADYIDTFPATSVNVAMQIGHNTVRVAVMGLENRAPTATEQATMERLIEEALEAGAFGLSSGPFTAPGAFARAQELEALASVAARYGAGYSTHLRSEAGSAFEALGEAIGLAERTGARTRIVHAKLSGAGNCGGAPRFLDRLAQARERGIPVDCDHYPYTTALNPIRNLLPAAIQQGGVDDMLRRLGDPVARDDIRAEIAAHGLNAFGRIASWDAVRISTSPCSNEIGRTIAEVATRRCCDPVDALCAILVADRGVTRKFVAAMEEQDVQAFVACPWVLVGSEGRAGSPGGPLADELPHPRSYGTFPRILGHYTRELGLLTLPRAIHKMTGAPAAALGLRDRGILRIGAAADVTVFDPATVADLATFDEPRRYPAGIYHVMVNGIAVVKNGVHTGALPGQVLRRTTAGVR